MSKREYCFATQTKNGVITKIGVGVIQVPLVRFGGGKIKWLDEKLKDKDNSCN